jgi:hypothetical protein
MFRFTFGRTIDHHALNACAARAAAGSRLLPLAGARAGRLCRHELFPVHFPFRRLSHAVRQSQLAAPKSLYGASEQMHHGAIAGRARVWGKPMNVSMCRSTQFRFATAVLFAIAAVALTGLPARAFSQGYGGTGADGNAAFADPDEQVNIFGFDQGSQPTGLSGSVQNAPRQDQYKYFRPDSLAFPPDPLSRPGN